MLHARLRPVTIYIWQRMVVRTKHLCGWGPPPVCLAPLCLASPRQAPICPLPASSPVGTAILSPAEPGTLTEAPQACCQVISPLFPNIVPSPASPRPQLQSSCPELCPEAGEGRQAAGEPHSAPCAGVSPALSQWANQHVEAPPENGIEGSSCSNPQQHWPCSASCSCTAGLEPILATVALGPADRPVSGAPGLEPGLWRGEYYRVRIATG